MIFTQNNWEFPVTYYEVHNHQEFIKVLDKRKDLVFKGGDNNLFEGMDTMFDGL